MNSKKYIFICNNDLSSTDPNGKTVRDVFSFVPNENVYCFSLNRNNPSLSDDQVFCANENEVIKFKKVNHLKSPSPSATCGSQKRAVKKNPFTCLTRYILWRTSFLFWKKEYKKWVKDINPDYVVLNISDFLFFNYLAIYTSKILNKNVIFYNTEDYPFKTWNYLHKENGFSWLYFLYRWILLGSYRKVFKKCQLCIHNVNNLKEIYSKKYNRVKHEVIYHPSQVVGKDNIKGFVADNLTFYYCGNLDKGRDKVFLMFLDKLKEKDDRAKVIFNGSLERYINKETLSKYPNLIYKGFCSPEEVLNNLTKDYVLLSVASLDSYNAMDKYNVFSTKLGDYIASFNPIFHIGPVGEETNILKQYNLAYVSSNANEIYDQLSLLKEDISKKTLIKFNNQKEFYSKYLKPDVAEKSFLSFINER